VRYCFQMAAKPVGPETSIFAGSLGLQYRINTSPTSKDS
jgi:hypothetical protein